MLHVHRYLRQLLRNVTAHEHSLQVHPQVLHDQPVLDDLGRAGQLVHPALDLRLERRVVPEKKVGRTVSKAYLIAVFPNVESSAETKVRHPFLACNESSTVPVLVQQTVIK